LGEDITERRREMRIIIGMERERKMASGRTHTYVKTQEVQNPRNPSLGQG
jgi:hypothetical protein